MTGKRFSEAIQSAFDEVLKTVNTAIPGYLLKFDPDTQLAEIQIGIVRTDKSGNKSNPPPVIMCPVLFSGGSAHRVEFELSEGDEGLIIFSQRCIDAWRDQGGVSPNPHLHFHSMNDAFFIPGVRSQKNKLSDFNNDGIRITDGTNYVWLKSSGDVEIKGSNVKIESSSLTHNGVNIGDTHKHSPGTYNVSGTPVAGKSDVPS